MKNKGDAYENLFLLFKRDGVPPNMVVDRSKEQTLGSLRKKCQEASCHMNHTEPYSPWILQAKGTNKETKDVDGKKIVQAGAPTQMWDDTLEIEAYVRSYIAMYFYMLKEDVPDTLMLDGTSDISQICEYRFYD